MLNKTLHHWNSSQSVGVALKKIMTTLRHLNDLLFCGIILKFVKLLLIFKGSSDAQDYNFYKMISLNKEQIITR